ncbi:hypothetical protein HOF40_01255 [Candidatus Parcubacteria bacterium]|jgi:uncharacterized membrane protein YozB (DUF420 family)|nr:hypothetical protein [Candidatus Parcubacteria bacterium]MBT3948694.1 hypothetical protein [Candidatus Parcubacteria bacterium]
MNKKHYIILISILLVVGFGARLLPHPANFAPIGALALFGGLYLPRKWALILPLGAMLASDIIIGFYSWQIMLSVYVCFALVVGIGLLVRKNKKFHTILGGTVLGSILFFLITNAAVWGFGSIYTINFSGLMQSYYMALPFFRNSLLGDLFFTGVLVGTAESVQYMYKKTMAEIKT